MFESQCGSAPPSKALPSDLIKFLPCIMKHEQIQSNQGPDFPLIQPQFPKKEVALLFSPRHSLHHLQEIHMAKVS